MRGAPALAPSLWGNVRGKKRGKGNFRVKKQGINHISWSREGGKKVHITLLEQKLHFFKGRVIEQKSNPKQRPEVRKSSRK